MIKDGSLGTSRHRISCWSGKLKLIDLELAKRIGKKHTYTVCGTVLSMLPEVLLGPSKEGYSYEFGCYGLGVHSSELTAGSSFRLPHHKLKHYARYCLQLYVDVKVGLAE